MTKIVLVGHYFVTGLQGHSLLYTWAGLTEDLVQENASLLLRLVFSLWWSNNFCQYWYYDLFWEEVRIIWIGSFLYAKTQKSGEISFSMKVMSRNELQLLDMNIYATCIFFLSNFWMLIDTLQHCLTLVLYNSNKTVSITNYVLFVGLLRNPMGEVLSPLL